MTYKRPWIPLKESYGRASKREAEEFHVRSNADEEFGIWKDYHFKMKDGGYLGFYGMDFGSGAGGYKVEVSGENSGITNGRLEFRLDSTTGPLIGECAVIIQAV